jgi:signal-transduction protein with cAMP-binding, CBS, and nucleotidyltransferase domain
VRKAVADRKDLENTTVESIMTAPLNYIDSTKTLLDAQDTMRDLGVRHLAVREGGNVVGIISVGDLLAYFTWRT